MTTSNRLAITELAATQTDRAATVNEAFAKLELGANSFACVQVLLNAPPGSPVEGDTYIIGAAPSGAWTSYPKQPVTYYNGAWLVLPVYEGMYADDAATGDQYRYDGSTWNIHVSGGGGGSAPASADYLVKTANGSLSAERVVTDTSDISWDWATAGQAKANLAFAVQPYDADTLKSDTPANLTAGFTATAYNLGTQTTGTTTPDPDNGNFQRAVNGGAHTLAPPSASPGDSLSMVIQYTNNGSAGAITTSGFTKVTGDALTTTNGDDFIFFITVLNGFSLLNVVAMQ